MHGLPRMKRCINRMLHLMNEYSFSGSGLRTDKKDVSENGLNNRMLLLIQHVYKSFTYC